LGVPNRKNLTAAQQALEVGVAIANGMDLAKRSATCGKYLHPTYLADQAVALARNSSRSKPPFSMKPKCRSWAWDRCCRIQGSRQPPN